MKFLKKLPTEEMKVKDLRGRFFYYTTLDSLELDEIDLSGSVLYQCYPKLESSDVVQVSPIESVKKFNQDFSLNQKWKSFFAQNKDISNADFRYIHMESDVSYIPIRIYNIIAKDISLQNSKIASTVFDKSDFENAKFKDSKLEFFAISHSNLVNSNFENTVLSNLVSFASSNLTNASFKGTSIELDEHESYDDPINFEFSILVNVNLSNSEIWDYAEVKHALFSDVNRREQFEKRGAFYLGPNTEIEEMTLSMSFYPKLYLSAHNAIVRDGCSLDGLNLTSSKFTSCIFNFGTHFQIKDINFENSEFFRSELKNGLQFINCNFKNCSFKWTGLRATFKSCSFENCFFDECKGWSTFLQTSLKNARFNNCKQFNFYFTEKTENLTLSKIESMQANGTLGSTVLYFGPNINYNKHPYVNEEPSYFRDTFDAEDMFLSGVNLENSNLESANFRFAELENVNFKNSDLRNVIFQAANLKGTDFEGANLEGASYDEGTTFEGSNITQEQIQSMDFEED
jgi:uncharacterized protein YjbI with pentapeptide repeats